MFVKHLQESQKGQAMSEAIEEKPKRQRKAKEPAAIVIPAPTKKPWELSEYEVNLVRNHIAKGASNEELSFCLGVARRYKLDPFRGQIWFVKRRTRTSTATTKSKRRKSQATAGFPSLGLTGFCTSRR